MTGKILAVPLFISSWLFCLKMSDKSRRYRRTKGDPVFHPVDPASLAHLVASEEELGSDAPDSIRSPTPTPATEAEGASLKSRVGGGVRWSTLGSVVIQLLSLARSAALTRLLLQSDFGLMGMAGTLTGALGVLTATGMGGSIVAGKFEDDAQMQRHLNTVWTVEVIRGVVLMLILCVSSPWITRFYAEDRLLGMLPILALTPLFGSLNNIGMSLLTRGIEIRRTTQFSLSSNIAVLAITVGLAFWWRSVWALVWGQVAGTAISTALTYYFHPYRPRFEIDREALRKAFSFGKWMFVIGVTVYVTTTVDNVFVGKILGARALGAYVVAYSIANLPSTVVAQVFGTVFFPAFAELGRSDSARLENVIERIFQVGAAMLLWVSLPMMLFAGEIVGVLFGSRWDEAIGPLRILVLVGTFRGFIQMISPLILGLNRPEIEGKSKLAEAALFLILIYPMTTNFGTLGAAWTGVLVYAFALGTRYRGAWHLAPRAFATFPLVFARLLLGLASGALLGEGMRRALHIVGGDSPWLVLPLAGSVTMLATMAGMLLLSPALRVQLVPITDKLGGSFKRR